jgi:predicted TIM-barrel fold metal-dependent hydrolase
MAMPKDIRIVDTFLDLPYKKEETPLTKRFEGLRDADAKAGSHQHPAGYLFKDGPEGRHRGADPISDTLREMDKYNIEFAQVSVQTLDDPVVNEALTKHRGRFIGTFTPDPNKGMEAVRDIVRAKEQLDIVSISMFPAGFNPQVPINDKRMYPIYAKCIELDIAVFCTSGIPGPRLPYECQYTGLVDEVCWFFPDLRFVFRHGCDPWADLAVKLLLKWPNLYYSTSAFAPKHYPKEIIEFANKRGADKIIYAGYYPSGLSLDRIFGEMPAVPFKDEVWPKFLRDNAMKVLKLEGRR